MSTRERRVTLALKWHHLDNLDVEQIQGRFEEEGIGSFARSTVRGYLNEAPKEEILEQIENKHADVRLQSAERYEQLYQRAREAEQEATTDETITAAAPKTSVVRAEEEPLEVSDWRQVPPGDSDRPAWATERDTILMFTEGERHLRAGDEYPVGARRGAAPARAGTFPQFYQAVVGVERDVDDPKGQAMARNEQAKYQEQKGDVLGIYSTDINMNVDGELDTTLSLDEATAQAIREADLKEGAGE
ncbi:hypothetical protein DJ73_07180 [Halorubrum sp. Ea1]|uniref:hypothetical protein n=1 Tax=Halorubrum sp. Ea1 TaxID=1480718 RepID=UPI000B993A7F|nr:hypothetical protein [Halorubrum sp. Ea1]OYR53585.1 hypothetical protein DJ73_07180 [Halorubrum sp. Ea1]